MGDDVERLLRDALAGDRAARSGLVRALAPVVQCRVYRALVARGGAARGRTIRQEVEDLTQDVMVALFDSDAKTLRAWDPARGSSFLNYVGLVAERLVGHQLRNRRRSPWSSDPTEDEALARIAGADEGHEERVASRQTLDRVWGALKRELTPRGWELFQELIVKEQPVETVCERFAMKPDALYAWRSRFLKRARALLAEIDQGASDVEPSMPRRRTEDAT
jgi:RNA polymerase sigma-70 factor (ECF subfamily)